MFSYKPNITPKSRDLTLSVYLNLFTQPDLKRFK